MTKENPDLNPPRELERTSHKLMPSNINGLKTLQVKVSEKMPESNKLLQNRHIARCTDLVLFLEKNDSILKSVLFVVT